MLRNPYFQDRADAGRQLAAALLKFKDSAPLVLGLPRGGVPVAYEVARALHAALDIALVRKLGAPGHPEVGMGALVDGSDPQVVLNEDVVQMTQPTPEYMKAETRRQLAELERRREAYSGGEEPPSVEDRTVILVDDGIATGGTVRAVLRALRRNEPASLILAVPVAPAEAIESLSSDCDDIVCLHAPDFFSAVGAYYADFRQTTDAEVIELLSAARSAHPQHGPSKRRHRRARGVNTN